jgi:hypothetical protein
MALKRGKDDKTAMESTHSQPENQERQSIQSMAHHLFPWNSYPYGTRDCISADGQKFALGWVERRRINSFNDFMY